MEAFVCVTCGTHYPHGQAPPDRCPVCDDERQYVGLDGQRWTTRAELAADRSHELREEEPGLLGVGVEPGIGIGQRALVTADGLMWDCVPLVDDAAAERLQHVTAISISHPHFYTGMLDWAEALDARILLHEDDREWIMRPGDRIELWSGDRLAVDDAHDLVRLGGHFPGGTVCLWRGAMLSGDIVQVIPDRDHVSFMWSYPNLIPLPAREVARMRAVIETLEFDRIHGGWWGTLVAPDARRKTLRSADRYVERLG